jgi:hypothetical protein
MAFTMDPLSGIDDIPWSRLVHWYGRATEIPRRGGTPGGPPTGVRKRQPSVLLHQPQHKSNLTYMRIADPQTG